MKRRFVSWVSSLTLGLVAPLVILVPRVSAATDTCVWTGGGSDSNFTTAANWSVCDNGNVPEAGDTLEFPANVTNRNPVNDMTAGTSFQAITFSGAVTASSNYTVTGNAIMLVGGVSNTMTGSGFYYGQNLNTPITLSASQTFAGGLGGVSYGGAISLGAYNLQLTGTEFVSLNGAISGSGSISSSVSGGLSLNGTNTSWTGDLSATAGRVYVDVVAAGTTAGDITIASGSALEFTSCADGNHTVNKNITLTGASTTSTASKLGVGAFCSGSGGGGESFGAVVNDDVTLTLSGAITLGSDISFKSSAKTTTLSGSIAGNYDISLLSPSAGKLVISASPNASKKVNGTYTPAVEEATLSDDQATTPVYIMPNSSVVLTGKRGDISVSGGTLKGTGTLGALSMSSGAVAPGTSPGCLTSGNLTYTGGSEEIELAGTTVCTQYDQQVVNGTVNLGSATSLNISLLNSFVPAVNNTFTIISNDGSDAVTGTFSGLAEGATVAVSGVTFRINYAGGDGNDVVLTVTAIPATAPDTGVGSALTSPFIAILSLPLILGIMLGVRKYDISSKKK